MNLKPEELTALLASYARRMVELDNYILRNSMDDGPSMNTRRIKDTVERMAQIAKELP